jgi:hypothetical protein
MWNFVGRQNDIQGDTINQDGNWLSGIPFIDELHLGSQDNFPMYLTTKAVMFITFAVLLGIIGLLSC